MARLEPDELAVPVGLEGPLDIGLADGHGVAGLVEAVVVDGDVVDGAVPSGIADQGVDRGGQELGGGGVEQGQAVARVGGAGRKSTRIWTSPLCGWPFSAAAPRTSSIPRRRQIGRASCRERV